MSNVQIFITPSSITIYDGNRNRLIVRKTAHEIVFESTTGSNRVNNSIMNLQKAIKGFITQRSKDNYKKRFSKLSTLLGSVGTHSFVSLTNKLEKNCQPSLQLEANDNGTIE